jgi:hypothetical protein
MCFTINFIAMQTIIKLLAALLTICTYCTCTKSKVNTTEELTKLLVAHNWHITQASVSPALYSPILGNTTNDYFTYFVSTCIYDNQWRFFDNNTYQLDEGATRCNSTDPQTITRKWSFSLTFDAINTANLDGSQPINYQLLMLTDYSLKIRRTIEVSNNKYQIEEMYHPQ